MSLILTDQYGPRNSGYVEIDHRIPGQAPDGLPLHFEADTYTCSHCTTVVILNPDRKRERYKCKGCQHHICDDCQAKIVAGAPCRTFAQFVDESREAEARQLPTLSIPLPWETHKE